jgi:D-sedoheptulose 7-phosphate isomerase
MFRLSSEEWGLLRSQIAILETGRGQHRKYLPFVFTEHGALQAANVLKSTRAQAMSVYVIRAFVRMREELSPLPNGSVHGSLSLPIFTDNPSSSFMHAWITDYLSAHKRTIDSIPVEGVARCIEILRVAHREDRQIFICGNGGSAANSSHFVTDLGKGASDAIGKRFRVMALTDNVSWMTAIGNDYSYDDVFTRQLANYARAGDLLIAVSVSGNSPNVVKALDWANGHGLNTIALVGGKRGRCAELAQEAIVIDDTHFGRVEDAQMHILHMLCYAFMEKPELVK